ncbi:unnamed protein product [Closterium sp. NIES-64]|nr:unnamed protein product [Closterium sp. NIES-64]
MASRQAVVVARRPDVLRDEMLCPIPPVNWKEETGPGRLKEPSPVASPVAVHHGLDSEACPIAPQDWRSRSQSDAPGRIAVPLVRRTETAASTASSEGDKSGGKRRGETATHESTLKLIVDAIQPAAQELLTKTGTPASSATPTYFAASQSVASALMSPRPVTGTPSSSAASSETGAPSGTLSSSSGSRRSSRSSSRSSACAEEVQLEVTVKSPDAKAQAPSSLPASTTASPCGKGVRALARHTSEYGPTRNSSEHSDGSHENCVQAELKQGMDVSPIGDFSSRGFGYTGLVKSSSGGPFLAPLFPSYASSAASVAAPAVSTTSVALFPSESDLSVSHAVFNPASARDAVEPAAAVTAARRVTVGGVAQFPCYQSPRDVFAGISNSPTEQAAVATGSCFGRAAAEGTTGSGRRRFSEASSREEAIRAGIEMGVAMGVGVEIGQRCRETISKGGEEAGADVPAVSCADWSELSHLCGKMDAAGIRIEQIDLTTLGDTVDDITIH